MNHGSPYYGLNKNKSRLKNLLISDINPLDNKKKSKEIQRRSTADTFTRSNENTPNSIKMKDNSSTQVAGRKLSISFLKEINEKIDKTISSPDIIKKKSLDINGRNNFMINNLSKNNNRMSLSPFTTTNKVNFYFYYFRKELL